jgi:hypothetical protein
MLTISAIEANNGAGQMVISWRTHKIEEGFQFQIVRIGYAVPTEVIKSGVCATRAQAMGMAKKWTRYYKAQERAA